MKALLLLTRQRLFDVLRSRSSIGFVILFPVVLLLVVGFVFMNGHPFERSHVAVVGDVAGGAEALAAFEEVSIERAADRDEALGKLKARMVSGVLERRDGHIVLTVGPRGQLIGRGMAAEIRAATSADVTLEVLQVPAWGYVHYLFAGLVAFSVMLSGLFATGWTMVAYRQNRFLKKLATTPLSKTTFVAALVVARGALIYLQIALMTLVGVLAFGLRFGAVALAWFAAICGLGLAVFMGIGFILACLIRTEDLVVDIVSAVNMPLVLLSEIFFPLDALPSALAAVGEVLPSTEMVRMLRAVLLYGVTDPSRLWSGLAILAGWTVVTFAIALKVFKWHK